MKIDTAAVLSSVDIIDVIEKYIPLANAGGSEHEACCPFHSEKSPSFKVNAKKQFYHCFGCGAHGDAIKFVQEFTGVSFREAVDQLTNGAAPKLDGTPRQYVARTEREEVAEWVPIMPVPDEAGDPPSTHAKRIAGKWEPCEMVSRFPYRDQQGNLLGYVARFEFESDGRRKKEYVPQTWCRSVKTGEMEWRKVSFPKPRPLYNLPALLDKPAAAVIVCEGEKKADAVERLLGAKAVGIAWAGGGKAVKHTSWAALEGRRVVVWRDNDQPGIEAAESVARLLDGIAESVVIVDPPEGKPDSWDLADAEAEGWTGENIMAHVKAAARLPAHLAEKESENEETINDHYDPNDGAGNDAQLDAPAYRALGYDHGRYFYLAGNAAQVIELSSSAHTKLNMLAIAPLSHWQNAFPSKKDSSDAMYDMAANAMMRQCERAGVYDPDKIRGRGAWWDKGRALLHVGDHLIVDGERVSLTDGGVENVYEAAAPLMIDKDNPLKPSEAAAFMEVCRMLQWERPISAHLLAGWIFLSPICGALHWRPHIWITGGAGTGKSWVLTNIIAPTIGNIAILPQSNTTEAGIRQLLGQDARPVIFDEAEGEDAQSQQRIQSIMGLARQASSENGGTIVKGSANGKAMTYRVRSMFAFSSIGVGVQQYADKTRVTILPMAIDQRKTRSEQDAHFKLLEKKTAETITLEFAARLRARAVSMVGVIRDNARTFASAGAKVIGSQRMGDQIGTMLAGAYALHSSGRITPEDALEWIESQDWSEQNAVQEKRDEDSCLSHIMEHTIRVNGDLTNCDRSVGELVAIVVKNSRVGGDTVSIVEAEGVLLRIGIKKVNGGIAIANSHTALTGILRGTPWAKEWSRILKRLPNAEALDAMRFGAGGTHRAVFIPERVLLD